MDYIPSSLCVTPSIFHFVGDVAQLPSTWRCRSFEAELRPIPEMFLQVEAAVGGSSWDEHYALSSVRGAAAVAGAALDGPSVPADRSAVAHSPRGWCDS